ncbi:hypothetical protein H0X48_03960 [Candidatus Dependentiae bacterium]|nr:hypothetical protein [Candidatus Dependentiae bacterium]
MKKLTLALIAIITCVTNYTLPYAWTIKNNTDGEISAYVIRKGTRRADDKAKAVKILSKKQAVIDLGGGPAGYCGEGVAAEGLTGSVNKMYVERVYITEFSPGSMIPYRLNYRCGNHTVTINQTAKNLQVDGMGNDKAFFAIGADDDGTEITTVKPK